MTTNFMDRAAKMIAEIRSRTCIEDADAEVILELLQDELDALNQYYEEEFYVALSSARNKAYDDGHSDGYADGYDAGYDAGYDSGYADCP